jgi:predicted nucleotidyltransferase
VVSLSGAHAYGFPSPDSDLDLKAIHVEPTARLLGIHPARSTFDRLEVLEGVEIDYTSNEVQMVLLGLLQGNGNYLERILGPLPLLAAPELASLREVVQRSLSRRLLQHYRGFATSQLREVQKAETPPAKKVLYVLRTALTGTHALRTGRIVTDLTELLDDYGLP